MEQGNCRLGEGECSVAGRMINGWCQKHYQRILKHGDPNATNRIKGDDERRFWSKVDRRGDAECWPWLGYVDENGYGTFAVGGKIRTAHAWAYEHFIGALPADRPHLDHACHSRELSCRGVCEHRRCVNYLQEAAAVHLEPVTQAENNRRAHRDGVSLEEVAAFRLRWEAGEHIAILAAEAGIGKSGLHKRFREMNGPAPEPGRRRSRRQRLTPGMVVGLHARYIAGERIDDLAAEIGCERTTIYNRFKRMGLPKAA